jgi:hypothetical protein
MLSGGSFLTSTIPLPTSKNYSTMRASFDVTSLFHELRMGIAAKEAMISSVESETSKATKIMEGEATTTRNRGTSQEEEGGRRNDEGILGRFMSPSLSLIFPRRRSSSTTTKTETITTLDARAKEIVSSTHQTFFLLPPLPLLLQLPLLPPSLFPSSSFPQFFPLIHSHYLFFFDSSSLFGISIPIFSNCVQVTSIPFDTFHIIQHQ